MTGFCPRCQRRHGVGLCPDVTVTHDGPPVVTPACVPKRLKHKYHNTPTKAAGRTYDSKAEARFAARLRMLQAAGEVVMFLEQTPLRLPGGTRYVVDFVVFYRDGTVAWIDVKGHQTETFKVKKREIEAIYPIEIEVVS